VTHRLVASGADLCAAPLGLGGAGAGGGGPGGGSGLGRVGLGQRLARGHVRLGLVVHLVALGLETNVIKM
jgi:hypothetical protein